MRSVCICGSKRFKDEMQAFAVELEKAGVIVFQPSLDEPLFEDKKVGSEYFTSKVFKGLTLEHFDWVRKADVCFIFNKHSYIGNSVTLELGYAVAAGKPVFALEPQTGEPCSDVLIDKVFPSAKELLEVL